VTMIMPNMPKALPKNPKRNKKPEVFTKTASKMVVFPLIFPRFLVE